MEGGLSQDVKELKQVRGTHFLSSVKGGSSQNIKRESEQIRGTHILSNADSELS